MPRRRFKSKGAPWRIRTQREALLILFGTPTLRRPDGFGLATVRPL